MRGLRVPLWPGGYLPGSESNPAWEKWRSVVKAV